MAERGEAAEIVDAVMLHRPGLAERRLRKAPAADAFLVGVAGEDRRRRLSQSRCRQRPLPDRLALGPHDAVGAVLLQLLAVAAVDQRIVVIGRDFEDQRQPFGRERAGAARKLALPGFRLMAAFGRSLRSSRGRTPAAASWRCGRFSRRLCAKVSSDRLLRKGSRFCHGVTCFATAGAGMSPGRPAHCSPRSGQRIRAPSGSST